MSHTAILCPDFYPCGLLGSRLQKSRQCQRPYMAVGEGEGGEGDTTRLKNSVGDVKKLSHASMTL